MLKPWVSFLILTVILAGCAHRGAMRVDCDGPLRPINRAATLRKRRSRSCRRAPKHRRVVRSKP